MSAFRAKKVKIETLGEYLKHAREVLKLDYSDVRRLTQIPEKFLRALEEGSYQGLPADVYVKGFLKSLSAVYRLQISMLLEQFEKERGVERVIKTGHITPQPRKFEMPHLIITPKRLSLVLALVLALGSLGYLVWQVRSVSAAPRLELAFPKNDESINSRSILVRGSTEPGSRIFLNSQEILVDEKGEFHEVVNLTEGVNILKIRAENKFGKSAELERIVAVKTPADSVATSTPQAVISGIELEIIVGSEDAWLKIESDGKVLTDGVVPVGERRLFKAEKELLLSTGNAGAIRAVYNGRDLGILGRQGEVLSNVRFSR